MDVPASITTPTILHQLKTPPMIDEAKEAIFQGKKFNEQGMREEVTIL